MILAGQPSFDGGRKHRPPAEDRFLGAWKRPSGPRLLPVRMPNLRSAI
jgi:hypothetical protein